VPHTLLLADDSVTIQRVIELTFADQGVDVVAVSNGDEAIAAMEKTPPDVVLADVGMPGRNGYDVARYIRDSPRLAHTRVLLLTGAFEPVDQARVAEVACDGVVAKPFEPQQMVARVKELLSSLPSRPIDGGLSTSQTGRSASLDAYFDYLDQALADLSRGHQSGLRVGERPVQEAGVPPAVNAAEGLLEELGERLRARLRDEAFRAAVADAVAGVTERVVREELDRIRRSLGTRHD
jgi:DNA-binding response OmpR family regulator